MIGPVMIGPSSSHTAGVVRIALTAIGILGDVPDNAEITFYNSFARTYEGHGSDKAIIAGLLGYATDDKRIRNSFDHADEAGMQYQFKSIGNASTHHPNTIKLILTKGNKTIELVGESLGGGVINISRVDGFKAHFSASLHTMVIKADDTKGSIAFIANVLSNADCNIATMSVSRKGKNDLACHVIEVDSEVNQPTLDYLNSLSWIKDVTYVPNIL